MVTRTYQVRTYGWQMNVHDSERIAGLLDEAGNAPVADGAQPDVVVFSTCAVRENADNKLDGNLGHLKPVKDRTPGMPPLDRIVVVCRSSPARTVRRVDRARPVHRAGRSGLCPPPHDRTRTTSLRKPQGAHEGAPLTPHFLARRVISPQSATLNAALSASLQPQ